MAKKKPFVLRINPEVLLEGAPGLLGDRSGHLLLHALEVLILELGGDRLAGPSRLRRDLLLVQAVDEMQVLDLPALGRGDLRATAGLATGGGDDGLWC